jgi:hypothetical protein
MHISVSSRSDSNVKRDKPWIQGGDEDRAGRGLFAPDVFLGIALLSVLGLTWALARTILTIRPQVQTV